MNEHQDKPLNGSRSLQSAPSHPQPAAASLLPALHLVQTTGPHFTITTQDGVQRSFLCLGIPPTPTICAVVHDPENHDPAAEDSVLIFGMSANLNERGSKKMFYGYGVLSRSVDAQKNVRTIYFNPGDAEFKRQPWEHIAKCPPYEVVYLQDAHGRLALGYHAQGDRAASNSIQILSGPALVPTAFHYALASRMRGGLVS